MAYTDITTLVAQNFIPELWLDLVQKAREKKLVAAKRVFDVSGFGDVKSMGDVLHVPKLSNYTAVDKTANTEVPQSATTESEFTLTINKHKAIRITVEDIAKAQSKYDLMALYTEKIGYGLALAIDSDILALYSGLSQTVGATASTDANLSYTNIVRANRMLDTAQAPQEDRSIIVDSYGMAQMRLITEFTRYDAAGQGGSANVFINGAIGTVLGIPVYQSENVQTTSVIAGSLSRGLVIQKEAFAYATQMSPKIEQWRNAPILANEIIGQELYGVAEYRDDHGVVLSYPTV